MAAAPSPTSSSSRRSMDCLSVDSETGKPIEFPSPLHRVTPKILFAPNREDRVLWLDFAFNSREAMEHFIRVSEESLRGVAKFHQLLSLKPYLRFSCLRIEAKMNEWFDVLAVVYEHFPSLSDYIGKRMERQFRAPPKS